MKGGRVEVVRQTDGKIAASAHSPEMEHCPGVLTTCAITGCRDLWDQHCQHLYYLPVFGGTRIKTIQKYPEPLF